jgi:hypothetical protein
MQPVCQADRRAPAVGQPAGRIRPISGLVLALFVTSTAAATIDAVSAEQGIPRGGPDAARQDQHFGTVGDHG